MSENREPERPSTEAPIKLDQVRTITGGATLVRAISAGQPPRFVMATPVQASTALLTSTTTIQAQVLPKVTVQSGAVSRISSLPVQATSASGFHVPRGAAAVANIAVPRSSSVATPIVRGQTLQTLGVTPSHSIGATSASGLQVSRSVVGGVAPWVATCVPATPATRQAVSQIRTPIQQIPSGKIVTGPLRPAETPRPILLHSTTQKQVTLTQQTQVQVASGEKGPQAVLKSYGGPSGQSGRTLVTSAPALNRISSTLPPAMVSLHPAVLVPSSQPIPIKSSVIAQPTHGATSMHFPSVSTSAVPPTLAINTVVSRPALVTVMLTPGTAAAGSPPGVVTPIRSQQPIQTQTSQQSKPESSQHSTVFIQSQAKPLTTAALLVREQRPKEDGATTTGGVVSLSSTVYSLPGGPYYETSGFQLGVMSRAPVPTAITQAPRPTATQGVAGTQQVRLNSVMVVDPSRSVNSFPPSEVADPAFSLSTNIAQAPKQTTSPRPSILRKRDPEGSPMKVQKNLTPVLSNLTVSAGSPPPQPGSEGLSGQSSSGSTTISANSSPGESPPAVVKQEMSVDDDREVAPANPVQSPQLPTLSSSMTIEMSPRKKPRKQQLTENQIVNEPTFSEDEMEFISGDRLVKVAKSDDDDKSVQKKSMSLLHSYRSNWKGRNNHFLRYNDVRPRDDKKTTIGDLANQKHMIQKLNGWKIYHLGSQMEDMVSSEAEFYVQYTSLLNFVEEKQKKCKHKDLEKDMHRISERIRANFQRNRVVKEHIVDAKTQVFKLIDHKGYVTDIINRNTVKRPLKKRERL